MIAFKSGGLNLGLKWIIAPGAGKNTSEAMATGYGIDWTKETNPIKNPKLVFRVLLFNMLKYKTLKLRLGNDTIKVVLSSY